MENQLEQANYDEEETYFNLMDESEPLAELCPDCHEATLRMAYKANGADDYYTYIFCTNCSYEESE